MAATDKENLFIQVRLSIGAASWIVHSYRRMSIYSNVNGPYALLFCQFQTYRTAQQFTRKNNLHRIVVEIDFTSGWHFGRKILLFCRTERFFTLLLFFFS